MARKPGSKQLILDFFLEPLGSQVYNSPYFSLCQSHWRPESGVPAGFVQISLPE
jgi:hypothetical protein